MIILESRQSGKFAVNENVGKRKLTEYLEVESALGIITGTNQKVPEQGVVWGLKLLGLMSFGQSEGTINFKELQFEEIFCET